MKNLILPFRNDNVIKIRLMQKSRGVGFCMQKMHDYTASDRPKKTRWRPVRTSHRVSGLVVRPSARAMCRVQVLAEVGQVRPAGGVLFDVAEQLVSFHRHCDDGHQANENQRDRDLEQVLEVGIEHGRAFKTPVELELDRRVLYPNCP